MSQALLEQEALRADLAGDLQAGIDARRALAQLEPKSATRRVALAQALTRAEAWREALQAYAEAQQRGAGGIDLHLPMAELHLRLGRAPLAVQHLKKALTASPEHPVAMFRMGVAMYRLRRFREAVDWLQRAAQLMAESPEVHFNLGLAHFEAGDQAQALESFSQSRICKRGAAHADPAAALVLEPSPPFDATEMSVNDVKLQHDLEQLEHLLGRDKLPAAYRGLVEEHRALLQEVRGISGAGHVVPFNPHRYPLIARTYKRPIHCGAQAWHGPAVNPKLQTKELERRYLKSKPQILVVDELLSEPALAALRRFCRESTVWNNIQTGYLGAYFYDGFASDLLLRVAAELRDRLPRVLGGHALQMLWGYKYDHSLQGIAIHADAAAVNVNFWITEDEANLDPAGGGLLVYPHAAPADWDFERFNRCPAEIMRFLESAGSQPIRIPHRANRAVIFDSDLFHATDRLTFREGYLNRRVNITLLYGRRDS